MEGANTGWWSATDIHNFILQTTKQTKDSYINVAEEKTEC